MLLATLTVLFAFPVCVLLPASLAIRRELPQFKQLTLLRACRFHHVPAFKFAATSLGILPRSSPLCDPAAHRACTLTLRQHHNRSVSFPRRHSPPPPASSSNPAYRKLTRWQGIRYPLESLAKPRAKQAPSAPLACAFSITRKMSLCGGTRLARLSSPLLYSQQLRSTRRASSFSEHSSTALTSMVSDGGLQ